MDRVLYVAMSGAKNIMLAQTSNSNNLANLNTTGFKSDIDYFKQLPVYGPGQPSRVYAETERAGADFQAGDLQSTGRALDVAITGKGWMAVESDQGEEAYSRRGDLRLDSNGLLRNGSGELILGEGGPISLPPHDNVLIAADGSISIQPLGQPATSMVLIDRIKLVQPNEGELYKGNDALFHPRSGELLEADARVRLSSGTLESSNVNAIEAMVNLIEYSRAFESQIKLMKAAQDNDAASARLLRMG
ncbi:MAG: flagellar basal-body rod protein FlgF [Gammaproteobacteria bacterium]|nr:flagellar basal-body rod protein FlgF [Gammaproteobacteria bacterium]